MKKKTILIIFAFIMILASGLRLWQLGHTPPSPDWDEVALGYDAYSIIHTGRDEFGKFLPVVLRSFDDYKPALYAYLAIPSVLIFGLSTFSVRLPSAIAGIIAVVAVFYLAQELFDKNKYRDYLALAASFFMAISPWSIQFSRVGFESNVGDLLNILMVLFFVKGLKKPYMLYLSAVFAGLGLYIYQSEKVFTPLLFIILILVYFKKLFVLPKKHLIVTVLVGLIVVAPMAVYIVTNSASLLRVKGTSIFSYPTEILSSDITKLQRDHQNSDKFGLLLDNRRLVYAKTILSGYISHFSLNWLFINGDISRHHAPNMGLIYLFELPLILVGIYMLIFGEYDRKTKLLIFAWFFLAPFPASITTGVPHAVRTLNFLPIFQIFSSMGFVTILLWFSKIKEKKIVYNAALIFGAGYLLFAVFNFTYYLDQYFVQLNYYDSSEWQYGYQQAADQLLNLQNKYNKIIISDNQPMDKSYMFFLFYLKFDPAEYQKTGEHSSGSFDSHHSFGRYTFRPIDWQKDVKMKNTLFIGTDKEIPRDAPIIKTIYNLNGTVAIKVAGT